MKILSALNDDSKAQIESMANELCKDYLARQDETANKNNLDALFNIGYVCTWSRPATAARTTV